MNKTIKQTKTTKWELYDGYDEILQIFMRRNFFESNLRVQGLKEQSAKTDEDNNTHTVIYVHDKDISEDDTRTKITFKWTEGIDSHSDESWDWIHNEIKITLDYSDIYDKLEMILKCYKPIFEKSPGVHYIPEHPLLVDDAVLEEHQEKVYNNIIKNNKEYTKIFTKFQKDLWNNTLKFHTKTHPKDELFNHVINKDMDSSKKDLFMNSPYHKNKLYKAFYFK